MFYPPPPSRQALLPLWDNQRIVQFSPYWEHKTTRPLFICICTFPFSSSSSSSSSSSLPLYNYPATLKHTNLIELRNRCTIMLLGLLILFSPPLPSTHRHQHVDVKEAQHVGTGRKILFAKWGMVCTASYRRDGPLVSQKMANLRMRFVNKSNTTISNRRVQLTQMSDRSSGRLIFRFWWGYFVLVYGQQRGPCIMGKYWFCSGQRKTDTHSLTHSFSSLSSSSSSSSSPLYSINLSEQCKILEG